MNQTSAIAASLKLAWEASTSLKAAVPGGLLYGMEKAGTARPYASLTITLGGSEWQTGAMYQQDYVVDIEVWVDESLDDMGQVQTLLRAWLPLKYKLECLTEGAWTLQIVPTPLPIKEDPERDLGENVLVARNRWTISLQELHT